MSLTSGIHKFTCNHLINHIYQLSVHRLQVTVKSTMLIFSHTNAFKGKFDLAVKKVKVNL